MEKATGEEDFDTEEPRCEQIEGQSSRELVQNFA